MNKTKLKEKVRTLVPDIRFVRKSIAKMRYRSISKRFIDENEIRAAEENSELKKDFVKKYTEKWPDIYKRTLKEYDKLLNWTVDPQKRKDLERLKTDIHFCKYAYGFVPYEYVSLELENKDMDTRKTYVSNRDTHVYQCMINDLTETAVTSDKVKTYETYKKYFHRDAIEVVSEKDYDKFKKFISAHPVFVKKPVYECGGRGIERVDVREKGSEPKKVFDEMVAAGKHICEEVVKQSEKIAVFNSSSVNTVRIVTLTTKNGVEPFFSVMRFGRGGTFVDNASSGGVFAGVDINTGTVNTDAYDKGNDVYAAHPDTGVTFKGFKIPKWDELVETCKEMSGMNKKLKAYTWDMALAELPDGSEKWVVIECNAMGEFLIQIVSKKGIKADFEAKMRYMDLMVDFK